MTLINEGASFPSQMWAVVRLLLAVGGKSDKETAKRLLTPPTLPAGETKDFNLAVGSLSDLGLATDVEGVVELTVAAKTLSPGDVVGFNGMLRQATLDPVRNVGLADNPDLDGPKDLVRALAWFLTQDPLMPLDWDDVGQLQDGALPSHLPPPIVNNFRWSRFVYWAPALGFAASSLLQMDGPGRLAPDCTVAVRETVLGLWQKGQTVSASEAVDRIIEKLPVLPGGAYSRSLKLAVPDGEISSTLSNALLTGEEDGWITLGRRSDAADDIFLADASGTRRVTDFTINGSV